jgi:6-pyruvoyl-tetrahydropterin synthase
MGCVMDFHVLEAQLESILRPYRHTRLNDCAPFNSGTQPSAERVAETIGRALSEARAIPDHARLLAVHVTESPGCIATWRA